MFTTEEELENASLHEPSGFVGVVFLDGGATSYRLRYPYNQLPLPSDYTESIGTAAAAADGYVIIGLEGLFQNKV